ncbi:MAG: hypothetical protein AAB400_03415 [Patescibacteria group bacterium]
MFHSHTHFKQPHRSGNKRGVSLLIAVIILGSSLLIISTSALVIGLGQREGSYVGERGGEASSLADGCMEEGYIRIRRDVLWGLSSPVPFTAPNGSCTLQVANLDATTRRIDVTAVVAGHTKHIRSQYSLLGAVPVVLSWEERND